MCAASALLATTPALAGSRELAEHDARKHEALRDETGGIEVGGGLTLFDMTTEWWDAVRAAEPDGTTSNTVTMVELAARFHLLKVMGISLGYYHLTSSGAGVADGAPASLSTGGFTLGIDSYPIGFRRVQSYVGVNLLMGDVYATVYRIGARIELGRLKIVPQVAFTDFTVDDEVFVTQSESWGWGASVQLSWTLEEMRP